MKTTVTIGLIAGSFIGGYIPVLFGADQLSLSAIFGNFIGGAIGIWTGYRVYQSYFS